MKRIPKKTIDIVDAIKSERGYTNKQLAAKLGISERTLYSYNAYFKGFAPGKHYRKPKPETIQKLKKLARATNVRVTRDVPENSTVEMFTTFIVDALFKDGTRINEPRSKLIYIDSEELEEYSRKQLKKLITFEIKEAYDQYELVYLRLKKLNITFRNVKRYI